MKKLGKLIRAKKAEKVFKEADLKGYWKSIKLASVFGGEAIITPTRYLILEKESEEDNAKIQELLLKNKVVYYLNCSFVNVQHTILYSPYIPLQVTPSIFTPPPSAKAPAQKIIIKSRSAGFTTMNNQLQRWFLKKRPGAMNGFRVFIACKTENEIIQKLSRAMKYDFMV